MSETHCVCGRSGLVLWRVCEWRDLETHTHEDMSRGEGDRDGEYRGRRDEYRHGEEWK